MMASGLASTDPRISKTGSAAKLARTHALACVDQGTLFLLARSARQVDAHSAGQGPGAAERNRGLLVVLSGHAVVGTPNKVTELSGAGEMVGEENVFGTAGGSTVRLLGQGTALAIPGEAVRQALEHSPRLAHALAANLARREYRVTQRMECHASRRGPERLGGFILRQLPAREASQLLWLPTSKTIIASLLSMTKESLSRGLAHLAAAALISVRGRQLRVPSPSRLAEACGCPAACTACNGVACAEGPA
jgi:CRP-like cAMP-binding protein